MYFFHIKSLMSTAYFTCTAQHISIQSSRISSILENVILSFSKSVPWTHSTAITHKLVRNSGSQIYPISTKSVSSFSWDKQDNHVCAKVWQEQLKSPCFSLFYCWWSKVLICASLHKWVLTISDLTTLQGHMDGGVTLWEVHWLRDEAVMTYDCAQLFNHNKP